LKAEFRIKGGWGLRILTLTSLFPNGVDPLFGVFIKERVRQMAKRHDLRVVAPVPFFPRIRWPGRWYRHSLVRSQERIDGMEVYHPRYFLPPRVGMAFYGLFYFFSIWPFLKRMHRRYPFDLIDAHYVYPDGLAAVMVSKVFKKPVVLSARGSDINLFITFPLIRRWIIYTLHRSDHIVAVSGALKKTMVEIGIDDKKISVVPNGIDPDTFRPISQSRARSLLQLPPRGKMLLSVGNLLPTKGFQYIIEAFASIGRAPEGRHMRLYIVGQGPYRAELEKQIERLDLRSRVFLIGPIPHQQLYRWYNAADLFCLASVREGWPNVVMEALACGLPVVATAVGGVPEILTSQEDGLLIDAPRDSRFAQQLGTTILTALRKRWSREKIARRRRDNTWQSVARRMEEIFRQTLSDRSGKQYGA
jgi:glycosyltransferase involved in cell wall biosynthesis